MEVINRESKTSTFFSIGYFLAGGWGADKTRFLAFEQALLGNGLEFTQTASRANGFQLRREAPSSPLQVTVESSAPQVHNLQIVAGNPLYDLDMFCRDAEAVTGAYQATWPSESYQVLNTVAKIYHFYSSQGHTFKYLWEQRLGQSPEDFKMLGSRPVSGGGLRLFMPPHATQGSEPVSIELRIESFLREPTKLLVETTFTWPKPRTLGPSQRFDPAASLNEVETFAANEVWNFINQSAQA